MALTCPGCNASVLPTLRSVNHALGCDYAQLSPREVEMLSKQKAEESPNPPPGHPDAVTLGCACPIMDNCNGRGYYAGRGYAVMQNCPLHGEGTKPWASFDDWETARG